MPKIFKTQVTNGLYWVEIPELDLQIICGCPADSVKHLSKRGLIVAREKNGVAFETGPNAILLSDVSVQNGFFSNLSEFPVFLPDRYFAKSGSVIRNKHDRTPDSAGKQARTPVPPIIALLFPHPVTTADRMRTASQGNGVFGLPLPDIRNRRVESNLDDVRTFFQSFFNVEFVSAKHVIGPGDLT